MGAGMSRVLGWPQRLHAYVTHHIRLPFKWGEHDCCTFCSGAVAEVIGERPFAEMLGGYSTRLGAIRRVRKLGYDNVLQILDERFERIDPRMAQRGDIVCLRDEEEVIPVLAVCMGMHAAALSENGQTFVPMRDAEIAWRIE